MMDQWLEKNVNLRMLAERIRPFFDDVEFESTVKESKEGYLIEATSRIPNVDLRIEVNVSGRPDDFKVEFSAGGRRRSSISRILGYLFGMFGGGYLLLREAQKQEVVDPLEKAFWKHVDTQVADLVDSANEMKTED